MERKGQVTGSFDELYTGCHLVIAIGLLFSMAHPVHKELFEKKRKKALLGVYSGHDEKCFLFIVLRNRRAALGGSYQQSLGVGRSQPDTHRQALLPFNPDSLTHIVLRKVTHDCDGSGQQETTM